jgi:ABC-2 type transport system ATP-binding protein
MHSVVLDSVSKIFRHRPAIFNWIGKERTGETRALNQVSFALKRGEILALLGPNGSGKSTTLKLISTLLLPDAGRVIVEGCDTQTDSQRVRARVGIAVAAERSFYSRLTARENLSFFATLDDVPRESRTERVDSMLDQAGLLDAADTLVMKFSSGMYQRLAIARALIKQPQVLLLDEPTRSLDPAGAQEFWDLLRTLRTTIVVATHNFAEAAAVADKVAILRKGKLEAWSEVRGGAERLRQLYFRSDHGIPEAAAVDEMEFASSSSTRGTWQ